MPNLDYADCGEGQVEQEKPYPVPEVSRVGETPGDEPDHGECHPSEQQEKPDRPKGSVMCRFPPLLLQADDATLSCFSFRPKGHSDLETEAATGLSGLLDIHRL